MFACGASNMCVYEYLSVQSLFPFYAQTNLVSQGVWKLIFALSEAFKQADAKFLLRHYDVHQEVLTIYYVML